MKGERRHTIGAIAISHEAGGCGDAKQKSRDYARPGALLIFYTSCLSLPRCDGTGSSHVRILLMTENGLVLVPIFSHQLNLVKTNVEAEIIRGVRGKRKNSEDLDLMICDCIHVAAELATAASMLTRHFCAAFLNENSRKDSLHYTDARGKSLVNTICCRGSSMSEHLHTFVLGNFF